MIKEKRSSTAALKAIAMPETLKMAPADAFERLQEGKKPTVLDVRGRAAHARSQERIEGDLRVEGTRGLPSALPLLPREGWMLAYCT